MDLGSNKNPYHNKMNRMISGKPSGIILMDP